MSCFIFAPDSTIKRDDNTLVLNVPSDCGSKRALLDWFAQELNFPEYFGWNWDSFDECLNDLSWIRQKKVVLAHRQLPLFGQKAEQQTYLNLLKDVVQNWSLGETPEIVVMFDPSCQPEINEIVGAE